MKKYIVPGKEVKFPSVCRESVYVSPPLKEDPKEYISHQGFNYFDDGNFQWWRNMRFGIITIHVSKNKKEICCKIRNKNKTASYLLIRPGKLYYRNYRKNIHKQGFSCVASIIDDITKLDYSSSPNYMELRKVKEEVRDLLQKYSAEILGVKSLYNIYHPLVDIENNEEININAIGSKYPIWKHLRTTSRLKDLTYIIFQTKGNKYTKYIQNVLKSYNYGKILNTIYMLVKYFGVKKEHIIDANHTLYNFSYYDFPLDYWRILKKLFYKLPLNPPTMLLDVCRMYEVIEGTNLDVDLKKITKQIKNKKLKADDLHDLLTEIYNSIDGRKYYKLPNYSELEGVLDTGYVVKTPKTSKELLDWGRHNSFCVGSYARAILNGNCIILGLWKNDELICAELRNHENIFFSAEEFAQHKQNKLVITQIKGCYNSKVDDEVVNSLDKYLDNFLNLEWQKVDKIEEWLICENKGAKSMDDYFQNILAKY